MGLLATPHKGARLLFMSSRYPPSEPAVVPAELDEDDEMTEEERREIVAEIAASEAEFARGEGIPIEEVLAEFRREVK